MTQERKSSFTYDDLLACSRGEMFGPANAQLPAPPMLMMDRISLITNEGGLYGKGLRAGVSAVPSRSTTPAARQFPANGGTASPSARAFR